MSFSELITKAVEKVIFSYVESVSKKYNISKDELLNLYRGVETNVPEVVAKPQPQNETSLGELNKLTKTELAAHCKARGLKTTGTKPELIERLTGNSVAKRPTTTTEKKTSIEKKSEEKPVIKGIANYIQAVQIKKNSFGNFEHSETGLIFDKTTHRVIGKQNASGKVDTLNDSDIEICNKYKFKYDIPENLDIGTKNKVTIDGLDDEVEDDDVIDEPEDLLEEEEELVDEGEDEDNEEEYFEDD